jgi:hypothetical protein
MSQSWTLTASGGSEANIMSVEAVVLLVSRTSLGSDAELTSRRVFYVVRLEDFSGTGKGFFNRNSDSNDQANGFVGILLAADIDSDISLLSAVGMLLSISGSDMRAISCKWTGINSIPPFAAR